MKKFFGTLFIIIIIALGLLWVFRANIASHLMSQKLGLNVVLEQFDPSPWGVRIKGAVFHLPEVETTITIDRLSLKTPFFGFFDNPIIVDRLEMKDVSVISKPGNIKVNPLGLLVKTADFFKKENIKFQDKAPAKSQRFVVKEITATNIVVKIDNPLGKGSLIESKIPTIELKNINQGKPVALEDLLDFLSATFLKSANSAKPKKS